MSLTSIFQPIVKRTKRAYLRLYDDHAYLFGCGSKTTIFPNGEREIWISNTSGTVSFKIRASEGDAGFAVTLMAHVGSLPTDAHVLKRVDYRTTIISDVRETTMIGYYPDEYSQQFKKWYECDARDSDGNKLEPHPDVLGLTPAKRNS